MLYDSMKYIEIDLCAKQIHMRRQQQQQQQHDHKQDEWLKRIVSNNVTC